MGLGAQKSGTTWWYKLIGQHEDVFVPSFEENECPPYFYKERHFLDSYYNTGFDGDDVEAYHKWFPRPLGMVTGEWTPRYLVDPSAPALLAKAVPDAKLLVLLRDPVSRFESGMAQTQRATELRPDKALIHYTRGALCSATKKLDKRIPSGELSDPAVREMCRESCDRNTEDLPVYRFGKNPTSRPSSRNEGK